MTKISQAYKTDEDACNDAVELWAGRPGGSTTCGDDPWNPYDTPSGSPLNVSGRYDIQMEKTRADEGTPGFYIGCKSSITQTGTNPVNLTAPILCYLDSPDYTVNPQAAFPAGAKTCPSPAAAQYCGDGYPGAPPPGTTVGSYPTNARLFADIDLSPDQDDVSITDVLHGTLDTTTHTMNISGCLKDRDGFAPLGNVIVKAKINAYTGIGIGNVYPSQAKSDCEGADGIYGNTNDGASTTDSPWFVRISAVRQASNSAGNQDGDGDGCPDYVPDKDYDATNGMQPNGELLDNPNLGGLRDPFNHYDYFNPTQDGLNRVDDILAVINQYFQDDPPGVPDLTSLTDRVAILGGNAWNLGAPNGQQRVDDILNAVKQYFHDCS
jgi:hypothetical protein